MYRTKFLLLFFLFSITFLQLTIANCKFSTDPREYPGGSTDSIGTVKKNGKVYILHKVEPKETFYGLSKRYGVSVEEIKQANPEVEQGLKIAQVIRIPLIKNTESINKITTVSTKGKKIHIVAQSQTLFSISKMYGITVDDLKNGMICPVMTLRSASHWLL
ncbi:MAG: LysM peptidoglycan-binding domain-containing protein [Bacteroidetes bacterium]|nr:LysM peptidoglycan-binding domain-containing protein [Bacteroidota bacterium]